LSRVVRVERNSIRCSQCGQIKELLISEVFFDGDGQPICLGCHKEVERFTCFTDENQRTLSGWDR
jgi:formylmethanofuran dehydrogenase subunit E